MTRSGITYYYHLNGHGDVIALSDELGNIVAQYDYDAWGNILSQSGSMATENPYGYAGYYYDEETGLYYLRARYYDPEIGRFIRRDTVQKINQYAYAENNPVMLIDPSGHYWKSVLSLFGIEHLEQTTTGYMMYSPLMNYFEGGIGGDIDDIGIFSSFIFPNVMNYQSRLFVNIDTKSFKNDNLVNISDYINLSSGSNNVVGRTINVYVDSPQGEWLYSSKYNPFVSEGYSNALDADEDDELSVFIPKGITVSRIELTTHVLMKGNLLYPYRANKINIYLPGFVQ
ncbi:RHS repeat-associated protein [Orenia metallireducens]|uniref:RHS repeat-associated core domain-containing protein n=1 Tax=Orenia metallireducens TaxID=1413210 RepID=A0A285HVF8_9FIRM|nr:RHS repeat-associated core domain-containing protein [Orenia metallireducens]PRX24058.1 RHS repeat-associated protein [Orenia metallireducens]SNY38766.1 RHS repeat-associated core domain-containing protein [Orenia metallireducens]